ncbi:DUF1190 family protein [Photobacterium aphoticum]|uniref:Uncharacterized protein n=1 Tax=Photobacterium aphoticum TaxID=754436 RepID=A0A090R9N5_9GAMM|nr:DUF1190 family protein [Photobacterium aphoticum]KLU99139.1 hypothetical protein ABT58_19205 [Photobacterium aphoticum]PSU59072.1 DUF1190 domain-containing protein [Photobacterium aphoticum]GAL04317.1 hypothetical protein JCM19237_989 [Photobacterium aphoticum]GHA45287.1 UPF0441 protein [Photobacterium aphoticum]
MKRSKHVVLASMRKNWRPTMMAPFTAILAGAALSGCSDPSQDASIYQGLNDCIGDNPDHAEECRAAYQSALEEAARTSPKYASRADCELEFGINACVQAPSNDWFMPAMAGFMFARLINSDNRYYSQPMFRSTYPTSRYYGYWVTSDGYNYGKSSYKKSKVKIKYDDMKPKPAVNRTIKRGGFGSSVSAKSSWSSNRSYSTSSRSRGGWGG